MFEDSLHSLLCSLLLCTSTRSLPGIIDASKKDRETGHRGYCETPMLKGQGSGIERIIVGSSTECKEHRVPKAESAEIRHQSP